MTIKRFFSGVMILLYIWFIGSWADIAIDNSPDAHHSDINLFALMTE